MSHLVLEFLFRTRANAVYLVVSAFLMHVQISHCFIQGRTHTHFPIVLFPLLEFDLESVKENIDSHNERMSNASIFVFSSSFQVHRFRIL